MKLCVIGDIHGEFIKYKEILDKVPDDSLSIQLGDIGLGSGVDHFFPEHKSNNKFVRGNHDNPEICRTKESYLGDYGFKEGIFYISGAFSIDYMYRKIGRDMWEDEQLSMEQLQKAIELYEKCKPEIVVSHECPNSVSNRVIFSNVDYGRERTSMAMETMFDIHQPKIWCFGHYHDNRYFKIDKTEFHCIGMLEHKYLNI
jgi:predicted phosphodiesterase